MIKKDPKIARKKLSKMALLRECETKYQSEKGLSSSKSETRAFR
jgi:hypothetical protein